MKLYARLLFVITVLSLMIVGCGSNNDTSDEVYSHDAYAENDGEEEVYESEEYIEEDETLIPIDLWEGISVSYKGWAGLGEIDKITYSADSEFANLVADNVTFKPAEEYHNLKDKDKIIINASYDENIFKKNGYIIEQPSYEISVYGVPTIIEATSYHDGLAWMNIKTADIEQWMAIDTNGGVAIKLDPGSAPGTHFSKGVCIINNENIVDKNGNIIWSCEKEGLDYAVKKWGADHVKNVTIHNNWHDILRLDSISSYVEEEYFGYTQVIISVDTFEYTGDYTGFLDEKGEWYLEPSTFQGSITDGEYGVYRAFRPGSGQGLNQEGLYNLFKNEFVWEAEMDWREYGSVKYKWKAEYYSSIHNGLIHENDSSDVFNSLGVDHSIDGFYDIVTGKVAIDLSGYRRDTLPYPTFSEGYCILHILNDQGAKYYVVLDREGKELITPRKDDYSPHGAAAFVSEGLFWDNVEGEGVTYYKPDGNKAFDCVINIIGCSDFHEDRAVVQGEDKVYYVINKKGEIVF
ncbi:MAG: hypothetical protein Q4F78_08815 [Bacillota bacterium]|nr:hypothetical protein [Bacillota bacterium]